MAEDDQGKPARPKIQLPSFREVQAAQKSKTAVNLFQARDSTGAASGQFSQPAQPTERPAPSGSQAAAASNSAPQASSSRQPPSMPSIPFDSGPGHSIRATGPPSTSYPTAYPSTSGLVDYKAMNASPNSILVSKRQDGNPVLKFIRNVRWAFADVVPDYILGVDTCALFLSMRFHLLKPEYIHHRIKELQRSFRLRVLMCHVDVDDVVEPLQQITRTALLNDVTLICGWSPEECARYLETIKVYETKPADAILGRTDEDYLSRLNAALTTVRGVNKTDVLTLGSNFNTVARVMQASMEELSACPGIGPTKVRRLYEAFHEPFRKTLQRRPAALPAASQKPQAGRSANPEPPKAAAAAPAVMEEMPFGDDWISDEE